MTKEETEMRSARYEIEHAMGNMHEFTHQTVSLALRRVARELSHGHANSLIDEFNLNGIFQIFKEFPDKEKFQKKFKNNK